MYVLKMNLIISFQPSLKFKAKRKCIRKLKNKVCMHFATLLKIFIVNPDFDYNNLGPSIWKKQIIKLSTILRVIILPFNTYSFSMTISD